MATTRRTSNTTNWTLLKHNNTSDTISFQLEVLSAGGQIAFTSTNNAPDTLASGYSLPNRRPRVVSVNANNYAWIKPLNPAVNKELIYVVED